MSAGVNYAIYRDVGGLPVIQHKILVQGGAGLASLRSGFGEQGQTADGRPIWTADGVVTPISDEDWEILKNHPVFIKHQQKGLVKELNKDLRGNHREVQKHAASMEVDGFRPLTKDTIAKNLKVTTATMRTEDEFRI
jgi:hypothetical protein